MEYLSNLFAGNDALQLIALVIGLVLVLLAVAWIFRKFMGSPTIKAVRGRQPRLAVTDAANLDDKRRLVLVRRDNVEHLVMIGGATDVLLESNIIRAAPSRPVVTPLQTPAEPALQPSQDTKSNVALGTAGIVGAGAIAAIATQADTPPANKIASDTPAQPKDITTVEEIKEAAKEAALSDVSLDIDELGDLGTDSASLELEFSMEAPSVTTPEPETPDIQPEALANLEDALGEELLDLTPELSEADSTANNEPPSDDNTSEPAVEDEMQKLLDELSGEKA